ncbi:MAG: DinB family protein [Anaerolineae bacterium]
MTITAEKITPKLRATREELLSLIEGLDEATLTWRPPGGGWNIRDTLAHLIDAERAHRRFVETVLQGRSTRLEGFDLDRWNQEHVARRAGQPIDELLDALQAGRQETLAFIAALPAEAWDRQGEHPALGQVSVRQVIRVIGVHERMHLKEIRYLVEAQKAATA